MWLPCLPNKSAKVQCRHSQAVSGCVSCYCSTKLRLWWFSLLSTVTEFVNFFHYTSSFLQWPGILVVSWNATQSHASTRWEASFVFCINLYCCAVMSHEVKCLWKPWAYWLYLNPVGLWVMSFLVYLWIWICVCCKWVKHLVCVGLSLQALQSLNG